MTFIEWMELASYVVTIFGFPYAIGTYIWEKRMERQGDEEELYQRLSDEYTNFLKLLLEHADLQLVGSPAPMDELTREQKERVNLIFGILISLFERAYILVYEDKMDKQTQRLWLSWEDYIREWCRRDDFRNSLPQLLVGEDDDFCRHIRRIAAEEIKPAQAMQN